MNNPTSSSVVCAECKGYAEPPFRPLLDLFGNPSRWIVCLNCYDRIVRPDGPKSKANDDLPNECD